MYKTAALLLLLPLCALSLWGQSLYGSGISPESALVRVIFADRGGEGDIRIGNVTYSPSSREESALYHPVSPGMYFFEIGERSVEIIPMGGKYYSLLIADGRCLVFEDREHRAPAKSQVYFYNILPDEKATIKVDSTGDILFRDVPPEDSVQTAINPLEIGFSLETEGGRSAPLGILPLIRGGSITVIALEEGGVLDSLVIQSEVAKQP